MGTILLALFHIIYLLSETSAIDVGRCVVDNVSPRGHVLHILNEDHVSYIFINRIPSIKHRFHELLKA